MADVKSKNLYELLGNDHDQDSDREPEPPTKAIDKPTARTTKRNAPDVAPARAAQAEGGRGGRRGGFTGNERAYNDRSAGRGANRDKPVDDSIREDRHPRRGGGGNHRGGRGATFKENRDDRRSHGRPNEHDKQANASWGGATGGAEWDDEKAGQAIANADAKDPAAVKGPDAPTDADGNHPNDAAAAEPEPEDNSKSYAEYLAEQAAKKLSLGGSLEARKPNEGSKDNKKWASAKPLTKEEEEEDYIAAREGKAGRQRQRKEKVTVDINHRWDEGTAGGRGGRGDGARGRGRGEFRGRGEGRGGRGGRGSDFRGGRGGGGERGGERGGRGGAQVNLQDQSAFPSLGGS